MGYPGGSVVKNLPATTGDVGLIPGLGRSPGKGNNNPLPYSCLRKPMDKKKKKKKKEIPWTEEPGGLQSMRSHKSWA